MTTFIIIGILFVLGVCALFLIFPRKSPEQIMQEDAEEASYWAEYAQDIKQQAVKQSVHKKFNGMMDKYWRD